MTILVTKKPIVIPSAILKLAGIKSGDTVEFTAKPGLVTIRKVKSASLASKAQPSHAPRR